MNNEVIHHSRDTQSVGDGLTGRSCGSSIPPFRAARYPAPIRSRHVVHLLRRAERFLRDTLPVAGRITPGLFDRVDDPLYPILALREALANAFCHRQYEIGGGSVGVAIYDDRLEILSPGALHFGLTSEALFQPHESLPWNPLIARVLYRRGIIESWGRGTTKMAELMEGAGLPRPEIDAPAGAVVVRFRPGRYTAPSRIAKDLTERQQQILELLASVPRGLNLGRIMEHVHAGSKEWEVKADLATLRGYGMILVRGRGRGARWRLT